MSFPESIVYQLNLSTFLRDVLTFALLYCFYIVYQFLRNKGHSLHHLLPSYRTSDLRLRGHPFQLPDYYTDLHKKSFVVRSLYAYIK